MLSLLVEEVYDLAHRGRVAAGVLAGEGELRAGDTADLGTHGRWEILGLEVFGGSVASVGPGSAVGVTVDRDAPVEGLEGAVLTFAPRPVAGVPVLTAGGFPVPDQAVFIALARGRLSPGLRFGTLVLDGLRVAVLDLDGRQLLDAPGRELEADVSGSTQVVLKAADGAERRFVGPLPEWERRPKGAALVARGARVLPDPRLLPAEEAARWHMAVTPATLKLRWHHLWQPVLLAMLATRGVRTAELPDRR